MRPAAIRALLLGLLALGGLASGAAVAGAQLAPIGTLTSVVGSLTSQTTAVSDVTGVAGDAVSGTADEATSPIQGAGSAESTGSADGSDTALLSGVSGTGAESPSGSGSSREAPARSAKSNPGSPRTRFDPLPRRYERLLERIEAGRNVEANMRRLRALLASASPAMRARVLRLISRELARLERGGLTPREQAAAERLRALRSTLMIRTASPTAGSALRALRTGSLSSPARAEVAEAAGTRPASGHVEEHSGGRSALPALPSLPLSPLPSPSDPPYWILFLLAAIALLPLLIVATPRDRLPSVVRGIAEARGAALLPSIVAAVALSLALALCVVLLVQALVPG